MWAILFSTSNTAQSPARATFVSQVPELSFLNATPVELLTIKKSGIFLSGSANDPRQEVIVMCPPNDQTNKNTFTELFS
jgi:hypothetical protein